MKRKLEDLVILPTALATLAVLALPMCKDAQETKENVPISADYTIREDFQEDIGNYVISNSKLLQKEYAEKQQDTKLRQ